MTPRALREPTAARDLVQTVIAEHESSLLRLARRFSLCADDAHDAYQRALEIFLRRAETVESDTAVSWLRTVVKHEALAVRRSRLRVVGHDEVDLDLREATSEASPDERALIADFTARSAEALRRLKPQEVRALWLKAQGHSYAEIGELCGWSYTKVNRCITEGRRAFLDRYAGIESGAECERWAPVLSAMADGEATSEQLTDARPHLRNCPACRATLRDFHDVPREVGAQAPPVLATASCGVLRAIWETVRDAAASLLGRAPVSAEFAGATAVGSGGTLAAGGVKIAALCASVSIAAGGVYCLDGEGPIVRRDSTSPKAPDTMGAPLAAARRENGTRQIDRQARRQTVTQLARASSPARSPSLRRKSSTRPTPASEAPSTQSPAAAAPSQGFTFESGDNGADTDGAGGGSPQSSAAQSEPQPQSSNSGAAPSAEFDGGGFE